MHVDEYRKLISDSYKTELSKKEKISIRNKLLNYKSEVIANGSSCPKEANDSLLHLNNEIGTSGGWSTWTIVTKITASSTVASIIGLILSIISITFLNSTSEDQTMSNKISELDKIQTSLNTLGDYVEVQKHTVQLIAKQKSQLESEREQIQKIIELDQSKLEALFEYQNKANKKQAYFEYFISFLIGVLSSSAVVLLTNFFQNRKKLKIE